MKFGILSATVLSMGIGSVASAGVLTLNPFPGTADTDSGISTTTVYTHAVDIASDTGNTTVNGVTFLAAGANYTLTGAGNTFNNYNGPADDTTGAGLDKLANDFLFGGNPATLTLTGLTPGVNYKLRLYVNGFGGNLQNFSVDDTSPATTATSVPRDAGNGNVPGSIDYTYTLGAGDTDLAVTITPQAASDTFHFYAFSNEVVVPEPASGSLLALGGLGILARRRRSA